jgi:hypothetical protein
MKMTMSSDTATLRCPSCAAAVAPGASWCGLCFSPMPVASAFTTAGAGLPGDAPGGFRPGGAAPARAKIYTDSRWKSGSMTFGPVGRVVLTLCFLLPYPLFFLDFPFGLIGAGIWTFVIGPLAMRDIWRPARRHHLPPPG